MEPPGTHVHPRRASGSDLLSVGGAVGAAALLLTTTGDGYLVAVLLGIATGSASGAAIAAVAFTAALLRWGSSSLAAIAGAQAVLGPGIAVGPWLGIVATAAAGVALVLAARRGWTAAAFGLAAGVLVAGPAATSVGRAAERGAAAAGGAALAVFLADRVPAERRRRVAAVAAVVAVVAAVAS